MYTMLDQRRRRWANVVCMLYKCNVIYKLNTTQLDSSKIILILQKTGTT